VGLYNCRLGPIFRMWAAQPHNVADGAALTNRELKKEAIARPGAIGDTLVGTLHIRQSQTIVKVTTSPISLYGGPESTAEWY
jgi:hypothetical protein